MVSKKNGKRSASKTPKKTRPRSAAMPVITEAHRELALYHEPFSTATNQPRIPDGKVKASLGYQSQRVGQLSTQVATGTGAVQSTNGVMEIIMFPGKHASMIVKGSVEGAVDGDGNLAGAPEYGYYAASVNGTSGINGGTLSETTSFLLSDNDTYAYWRLVSQGLKLSLLNPCEQDDGWWEACRITEPLDTFDYWLYPRDNKSVGTGTGKLDEAAIAPIRLFDQLEPKDITRHQSYCTGLLRDLEDFMFKLNPIEDEHDMRHQMSDLQTFNNQWDSRNANNPAVPGEHAFGVFSTGIEEVGSFIDRNVMDKSYDMIYIKLHGRISATAGETSRYHFNLMSNHEIIYDTAQSESRFQKRTNNIGADNMAIHNQVSAGANTAAILVP